MNRNNKAVECWDTQAAEENILGLHCKQIIVTLKAAWFRIAAWVSIVGCALL
jgi:hypothetical protein